jgi:DNA adenine methylase
MIKSPLRFPGGKSRAIAQMLPLVPDFEEYREPMVGGGSLFLALKQKFPHRCYWINDINYELYCFWKVAQERADALADAVHKVRQNTTDGRALFYRLLEQYGQGDEFERAVRFFVLNRITFSGTVDSGGYSEQAFHGRFTALSNRAHTTP